MGKKEKDQKPGELTPEQKERLAEATKELAGFLGPELAEHLADRIRDFVGDFGVLETAVGALVVGRVVGWRVLYLVHAHSTIRKYEKVLGLEFKGKLPWDPEQGVMDERGPYAMKSQALKVTDDLHNFWEVVTNRVRIEAPKKDAIPDSPS